MLQALTQVEVKTSHTATGPESVVRISSGGYYMRKSMFTSCILHEMNFSWDPITHL